MHTKAGPKKDLSAGLKHVRRMEGKGKARQSQDSQGRRVHRLADLTRARVSLPDIQDIREAFRNADWLYVHTPTPRKGFGAKMITC